MNDSQRAIFNMLDKYGPACNRLISEVTGVPECSVTPRIYELRQMGQVDASHKAKYPADSGRTVNWWKVADASHG